MDIDEVQRVISVAPAPDPFVAEQHERRPQQIRDWHAMNNVPSDPPAPRAWRRARPSGRRTSILLDCMIKRTWRMLPTMPGTGFTT
jgi:hypothetical protein